MIIKAVAARMPAHMHPQALLTEIAREYNLEDIWYLDLWPVGPGIVVITNPDLSDQVAITKRLPRHRMTDEYISPVVGLNFIATSNGAMWKQLHTAMSPAFSWSHIRNLTDVIADECVLYCKTLDRCAESGEVFSMEQVGAKLIFDIIGRIIFNIRLHAQTTGTPYLNDLRELIAIADAQTNIAAALNPVSRVKMWMRKNRVLKRMNPSIMQTIEQRLAVLQGENAVPSRKDPNSILDLMLREFMFAGQDSGTLENKRAKLPKQKAELLITKEVLVA